MAEHAQHAQVQERLSAVKDRMSRVKHKIIVLSGKGGVGKSTVAANLAIALSLEGKNVGLLDIDLHGPTIPQLLGLKGRPVDVEDETLIPVDIGENLKVMSIGFLVPEEDAAVVWRGPMKATAIEQFLAEVEWGELDYLIIDSPPGTGDEPLAVIQAIGNVDGAIIVTTPQDTAVNNVRRSLKFCSLLNLPVLGVIENMSGFVCPHCGQVTDVFSKGGGEAMAAKAGVPFLGRVPLDPEIASAGDAGKPYIYHYSKSRAAQEFAKAILPILALDESGKTDSPEPTKTSSAETSSGDDAAAVRTSEAEKPAAPPLASTLRLAIPVTGGLLSPHFGHCEEFALVDVDRVTRRVLAVKTMQAPEHQPGLLPAWLAEQGVNQVIAGGMGTRAQQLFAEQGIQVVTGAPIASPGQLVEEFLEGTLKTGDNVCDH